MKTEKEARKMSKFVFRFGKWKFEGDGKNYRDAVRKLSPAIKKTFKTPPKKLPILVQILNNGQVSWWDIREFFKEAGIEIRVRE